MHRFFCEERLEGQFILRDAEENKHIEKVLRLKVGERVELVHEGTLYLTKLTDLSPARFVLIETLPIINDRVELTLIQGYPKGQKLQDIIRHGTELGIHHFIVVEMERSVPAGALQKNTRFQRIAEEAAKQSKCIAVPTVQVLRLRDIDFAKFDQVLFFYENSTRALDALHLGHIAMVIGPEGGFSEREVDFLRALPNGVEASLGKRTLRTETASLAATAIIRDRLGDL